MIFALLACVDPPPPEAAEVPDDVGWTAPDTVGPYSVGVRTEQVDDPRGGALTVEVWYPAIDEGPLADYGLLYELDTQALRDAPVRGASHPLVAFSHGHGGARHQSIFLTERVASHGFVVVSVDHPFDTIFDFDATQTPTVAARRPGDVEVVIDWALAAQEEPGHWLLGAIRPTGIAMAGHSFGAWTTLVLAGATLDVDAGNAMCSGDDAPPGCGIVGSIDDSLPVPQADPRITTSVVLAPGGWYSFSTLDAVHDILVVSGTADGDLPMDEEQEPTWQALGSPRQRLLLQDGGHFGFTDACALVPIADCAGEADGYMEPLRMQELTMTAVTAFLGVELLEDDRYAPWLVEDAWPADAVWQDD